MIYCDGVVRLLADEFGDIHRFVSCVYPSSDGDDVITSPYNSVLAMNCLTQFADCVLPIENQALMDICDQVRTLTNALRTRSHVLLSFRRRILIYNA